MDFLVSDKMRIETFTYQGKKYEVEIKDLSWTQKNKIIGKATKVDRHGSASFDVDVFNREILLTILGKFTVFEDEKEKEFTIDAGMMLGVKSDFGAILEKFIPSPAIQIEKETEKN